MDSVALVKSICKERHIPISKLERDCGFSNGYIRKLKEGKLPSDRLQIIADYLDVSVGYLLKGKRTSEEQKAVVDLFAGSSVFITLSPKESDLIKKIRKLNDLGRERLEEQLTFLLSNEKFTLSEHEAKERDFAG